jgi:hypothetical protein
MRMLTIWRTYPKDLLLLGDNETTDTFSMRMLTIWRTYPEDLLLLGDNGYFLDGSMTDVLNILINWVSYL